MARKLNKTLALVLCIALCLGLCIPALAADYASDTNGGDITATVTATPDSLTAGADGSVTVTVVFSEAIQCSGFNAGVSVPSGWSTSASDVKVTLSNDEDQRAGYNGTQNTISKALSKEFGTTGEEYALVTGFSITYTVTGAAAGEQTVGLTNLEVKKVGLDTAYKWAAATAAVNVSAAPANTVTFETAASPARVKQGESVDVTLNLKTADVLAAGTLQFAASDGTNSLTIDSITLNESITGAENNGNGKISFGSTGASGAANLPADTLIATVTFATDANTPVGTYTVNVTVPDGQGLYSAANASLTPGFGTSASFEVYKALASIAITEAPTKTEYTVGDSFDPAGMVVTATYTDNSTTVISLDNAGLSFTPSGALTETDTTVTVTYAEDGVTATATQMITVSPAAKYTVTFNSDGGTPEPAAAEVTSGEKVSAPTTDPAKSGYDFQGWYLLTGDTLADTAYNFDTPVTGNITLKAVYTPKTYTVTVDVTPEGATLVIKDGETVIEPNADGSYSLTYDKTYTYTLSAEGYSEVSGTIVPSAETSGDWVFDTGDNVTLTLPALSIAVGDIDGDGSVTVADAQDLFNYLVGKTTFTDEQLSQADVDGSGTVNSADIVPMLNLISKLASASNP